MQSQRRPRRSSEEIRTRLIQAARELFAEKGYEATTTRDICAHSGVAQQQLFQNFGSKEGIFDAAFVPQLAELINRYIATFDTAAADSTIEERVSLFVNGLFDLARENRNILLTAVSRRAANPDQDAAPSHLLDHIARTLHEMETIQTAPPAIDVPAAIIAAAGMVLGVALLEDMLYPAGSPRLNHDRLTTEMINLIVYGSVHRQTADQPPPTDPTRQDDARAANRRRRSS
jgi:AcrR family transcriptional regulator